MMTKCKCCFYAWFSGFFGLAAVGHTIRLLLRVPVHLGSYSVPLRVSLGVAIVTGALSFLFCRRSCAVCSCAKK